jgi:hypothetical protein
MSSWALQAELLIQQWTMVRKITHKNHLWQSQSFKRFQILTSIFYLLIVRQWDYRLAHFSLSLGDSFRYKNVFLYLLTIVNRNKII